MLTRILTTAIRIYQLTLSAVVGNQCRFYPSCSQYTSEAIQQHGSVKGIVLGTQRICRCHPFNEGGYDPVPSINDVKD